MPFEIPTAVPPLATARLVLRGLEAGDEDGLFAVYSNLEVARYLSRPALRSRDEAVAMLERNLRFVADGTGLTWAMVPRAGGALVGTVALFDFNVQCARAEIGYILGREHWGKGLMHEALVRLVEHAFGPMELRRLEADADPRNAASLRALARLGFVREGLLRERWVVAGEVSDTALHGLLAREWQGRREAEAG